MNLNSYFQIPEPFSSCQFQRLNCKGIAIILVVIPVIPLSNHCRTSVVLLSYHCRNKFVTNSNQIRNKFDTNSNDYEFVSNLLRI